MNISQENKYQQNYYTETANNYESMHIDEHDEHQFALGFLISSIEFLGITSVLDIGSGTGRAVFQMKKKIPNIKVIGVEPVQALREIGYQNGLHKHELIEGDATNLEFSDGEFDLVCAFGVLHHIRNPETVVKEMLRVAKKAIFISDANNFGQGSITMRFIKQSLNLFRLWRIADIIKTKGKGYAISEGDGLAYSYSVFNNYKQIEKECSNIHLLNTIGNGINLYRSASHLALLGIKHQGL